MSEISPVIKSEKVKYPVINGLFVALVLTAICVGSFVYMPGVPDVDFMPRMILYGIIVFAFSLIAILLIYVKGLHLNQTLIKHPLLIIFFLFVMSFLIAYTKSINPGDAVTDVLKMFLLLLVFILFIIFMSENIDPMHLFSKSMILSTLIFLLIAIWQIGTQYLYSEDAAFHVNWNYTIYSSHGNKNSFTECLAFQIPFHIYAILFLNKFWKYAAVTVLIFAVAFILLLNSASSIGAISVSVIIGFLLWISLLKNQNARHFFRAKFILAGIAIILVSTVLIYSNARNKFSLAINYVLDQKTQSTNKPANNSINERLVLWKSSLKMIKENPVRGKGLDNWKILLPGYHDIDMKYFLNEEVKFTRPHCDYLLLWSEAGLPGIITFLGLLLFGLLYSYRISQDKNNGYEKRITGILLFSGVLIYSILALSGFPTERIFNVLILIVYLVMIIRYSQKNSQQSINSKNNYLYISFFICAALLAAFSLKRSLNHLRSEIALRDSIHWKLKGNFESMLEAVTRIDDDCFPIDYTATPIAWYKATAYFKNNDPLSALYYYKKAEQATPYHFQVLNDLGTCYDQTGNKQLAEAMYRRALAIYPEYPDAILNLSAVLYNGGKIGNAYAILKTMPARGKSERSIKFEQVIFTSLADSICDRIPLLHRNDSILSLSKDLNWLRSQDSLAVSLNESLTDILKRNLTTY